MCIILFIYTSKNILLLNGVIFGVFCGPDEHFSKFLNNRLPCGQW